MHGALNTNFCRILRGILVCLTQLLFLKGNLAFLSNQTVPLKTKLNCEMFRGCDCILCSWEVCGKFAEVPNCEIYFVCLAGNILKCSDFIYVRNFAIQIVLILNICLVFCLCIAFSKLF